MLAPAADQAARSRSAGRFTEKQFPWPDWELASVAFRCKAEGADEETTIALFEVAESYGVRRLEAFFRRVTDKDFRKLWLVRADAHALGRDLEARHRSMVRMRQIRRWPWRTSTSQHEPGSVAPKRVSA